MNIADKVTEESTVNDAKLQELNDESVTFDGPDMRSYGEAEASDLPEIIEQAKKKEEEKDESSTSDNEKDESAEQEKEESTAAKEKTPKGVQKRIDELTYQREEAERKLREAEEDRNKWRKHAIEGDQKGDNKETPEPDEPEPKAEDFDEYDDYVRNLVQWNNKQTEKRIRAEMEERESLKRNDTIQEARDKFLKTAQEEARERHEDYDQYAAKVNVSDAVIAAAIDSPLVAEIDYYFGKNPEEAERISSLRDPIAVAREIGKLEATLTAQLKDSGHEPEVTAPETTEPEVTKKTTKAPPPVNPVKGSSTVVETDLNNMTYDQYCKARGFKRKRL